jgi:general stress protein CsbA
MTYSYTFTLGNLTLADPNLFLTDMVMAIVGLYCYLTLKPTSAIEISSFGKFFLFTGIATFINGFGHLFTVYTDQYLKVFGWIFSVSANFFIVQASIQYLKKTTAKNVAIFAKVKFLFALIALFYFQKFFVIAIDTAISIAMISLPIHLWRWNTTKQEGYKWFCGGVVFTLLTTLVGAWHLSIDDVWFNEKDINHLIVCGGMLLMHKGLNKL